MKLRKSGTALAAAVLLILGAGWIFGIGPQLSDAAATNANRANVMSQNVRNEILLAKLKKDYQGIDSLRASLDLLRAAVPASASISTFVTELNHLANAHQVIVRSISVNDAKPYTPVAPQAPSSTGAATPTTLINSRITSKNFVVVPVQFSITGNYSDVLDFVYDVQTGQRLFLISTFASTGSTSSKAVAGSTSRPKKNASQKVDASIGGYIYVLVSAGN